MAANDSTRARPRNPARTKVEKARGLTLRSHEAKVLARDGRVTIAREVRSPASRNPETRACRQGVAYPDLWAFTDGDPFGDGTWGVVGLPFYCPFGPVGSTAWGRESWSPDHSAFYPHFPVVHKACGQPAAWEIENGRVYSDEAQDWFPFRWLSATSMPRHASRFPRLIHEACEVKRVQEATEDQVHAAGSFFATHVLYNGSLECGDWRLAHRNVVEHYSPGAWDQDRWFWFSTFVVADQGGARNG